MTESRHPSRLREIKVLEPDLSLQPISRDLFEKVQRWVKGVVKSDCEGELVYGILMANSAGESSAVKLVLKSVEHGEDAAMKRLADLRLLLPWIVADLCKGEFSGLLLPCPFIKKMPHATFLLGYAIFGCVQGPISHHTARDAETNQTWEQFFGTGTTRIIHQFIAAASSYSDRFDMGNNWLVNVEPHCRSYFDRIFLDLMLVDSHLLYLGRKFPANDLLLRELLSTGVREVHWMPSIPATTVGFGPASLTICQMPREGQGRQWLRQFRIRLSGKSRVLRKW